MFCLSIEKLPVREGQYKTLEGEEICYVDEVKDPGVILDMWEMFMMNNQNVKNKALQVSVWMLRTFQNRSIDFLHFLFKTHIFPYLDYCCQLWAPSKYSEREELEAVVWTWTH